MILTFVRHGQSANNAAWIDADGDLADYRRVPEPVLTPLGEEQARAVATWLGSLERDRPTHLYCSPMVRAVLTAAPIATACGLPLRVRLDCFEVGGPYVYDDAGVRVAHPGTPLAEVTKYADGLEQPAGVAGDAGWWAGPYESEDDTRARARAFVAAMRAEHRDADHAVVVSHQAFGQFVIAELMGFSAPAPGHFSIENGAQCRFDLVGEDVDCRWVNRRV